MKAKAKIKWTLDVLMTIALFFLMGYQFWGKAVHEWIGTGMFVLFIAHQVCNLNWYKSLFRGRYTPIRILQCMINILTLAAMLALMYSGITMSRHVFAFLPIRGGMGLRIHALLGIALCVLFLLHHFLNIRWYAVLFKGQYHFRRIIMTASDFLLFFALLAIMLSSLMISGLVFPFSFLPAAFYWRDIYMMSTAWGFVLMAFHLGVHSHSLLSGMEKRMSETIFGYVIYLPQLLVWGAGIYGFLQSGLWNDMRMIPQNLPPLPTSLFYVEYIGMIGGMCVAVIMFRFYEISDAERADNISTSTNSQSAVKARDLRSNDKAVLAMKKAYEQFYPDGYFVTKRGEKVDNGRYNTAHIVNLTDLGKQLIAWHSQRPNLSYGETKIFDKY